MNEIDGLTLRASGRVLGRIAETAKGVLELRYDPSWIAAAGAYPLSLTLPLRVEPHEGEPVSRWLDGLLPYGALRRDVGAELGCARGDGRAALGWLEKTGADSPGAVSFAPPSEKPPGVRPFDDPADLLKRWEEAPLMLGAPGVSHTLAEDSDARLPVLLTQEREPRIALALHGAPSTHLLWLEPKTGLGELENRAFHLALGGVAGLEVCGFRSMAAGGRRMLLIERDDRLRRGGGWTRLHRETLAQALGARVEERYGREPGACSDLEAIFLWADGALEARERLRLLDAFLFNALIGASDAHLLRYAIRLAPQPQLAPLMELAGPGLAPPKERRFAQRIGGAARWPERITAEQWRDFAVAAKLNPTFTLDRLNEMAEAIRSCADPVAEKLESAPYLQRAILGRFARQAQERAAEAIRRLGR